MKRTRIFIGLLCLLALAIYAANPTFQSFVASQFSASVPGNTVAIKNGALVTNMTGSFIGDGTGLTNAVNAGRLFGLITNAQQEDVTNGTPNPNYAAGIFTGDSQSTGYMATPWPYFLTNNFGVTFGYATNTAVNSETAYSLSTNFNNQIGQFTGTNQTIVFVLAGILDVGGSSVDTVFNSLTNIYARCHASNALVVAFTLPPILVATNVSENTIQKIGELNQKLRYSPQSWDYLVDIASGVVPDIFNTNYFVDGLHMSTQSESNLAYVVSQVIIRAPHANTTVPTGRPSSLSLYAAGTNGSTVVFGPDNLTLLPTNALTLSGFVVTNVTQAGSSSVQFLAGPPGADALFELFAPQKNWIIGNSAGSPGNLYFNDATDGGYPFYIAPQASFGALVLNGAGVTVGTFSGSGAALTALNASALASGTVPLARLPGAVLTNNEAGTVTFANNFYGSGFGYFNQLIVTNGVTSGNTILNYQGNGQSGFGILAPLVKVHIYDASSQEVERHDSGNVNGAAETFYNRGTSFAQIGGSLGSAVSENTNDLLFLVTSNIIFSATTGANGYYVSTRWDNAGNIKTLGAVNATNGFAVGAAAGESYVLTIQTNAVGPHGYTITFTGGIETAHAQY